MDWFDVIKVISTATLSTGIVGIIIFNIIRFSADRIAEKLSKKYEFKLNEKLETYKGHLDKKYYISKMRFDLEFSIYAEIAEILLIAYEECYWLFPVCIDRIPQDNDKANELYKERYKKAKEILYKFQHVLGSKSPFISEELYNDFIEIKNIMSIQITAYEYFGPIGIHKNSTNETHIKEGSEAWARTNEITNKHNEIIIKMRKYFDTLEII
jgi:hypothetical protein